MPLQCEVCGSQIHGQLATVQIDGGTFRVCNICAKLGTPAIPQRPIKPSVTRPKPSLGLDIEDDLELRRDFNLTIRQARERMGLSQEELGRKINEKPSVIRLLESGKLKPDSILAKKIGHFLRIEMMTPRETE